MIIEITRITDLAKIHLGLEGTTKADPSLKTFINQGATKLTATDSYVIACTELEIDCGKAKLPDYFEELKCFQFDDGCSCSGACSCTEIGNTGSFSTIGNDTSNPTSCGCGICPQWYIMDSAIFSNFCGTGSSCGFGRNVVDVQGGYLYFSSQITATTVKIWYKTLNVDENGVMIFTEEQEEGLACYAAFWYANKYANTVPPMYNTVQMGNWQRQYLAQFNNLNGKRVLREMKKYKYQIQSILNAILIDRSVRV